MASTKVQATKAPKPRIYRAYSEIMQDLNTVKCQLTCASRTLSDAQDVDDHDLGARAWKVIDNCVERLDHLDDDFESWHAAHEHSPKGVCDGQ